MPVIASAAKKLRQSQRHALRNHAIKEGVKDLLVAFRQKPTPGAFSKLTSALDKAAKTNVFPKNKVARLKSRLSRLLTSRKK